MRRFWITFDGSDDEKRRSQVDRGVGVTARDVNEALAIIRETLWRGRQSLPVRAVVEDVDISTLDHAHVVPNMALPFERGIWFPLGYR